MLVQAAIEAQHSNSGAVVDTRVLEPFDAPALHDLDVDLDRVSRLVLLKQFQLPWSPARGLREVGQPQITEHPLNRACCHAQLMNTLEPDLRSTGTKSVLEPRLLDQGDRAVVESSTPPSAGVPRQETSIAVPAPSVTPLADSLSV